MWGELDGRPRTGGGRMWPVTWPSPGVHRCRVLLLGCPTVAFLSAGSRVAATTAAERHFPVPGKGAVTPPGVQQYWFSQPPKGSPLENPPQADLERASQRPSGWWGVRHPHTFPFPRCQFLRAKFFVRLVSFFS